MNLADLQGTFGFYRFGTTHDTGAEAAGTFPLPPVTNIAAVGWINFDGTGNWSSSQQTSRSGVFDIAGNDDPDPAAAAPQTFPDPPAVGTYTVSGNTLILLQLDKHSNPVQISQGIIINRDEYYALATRNGASIIVVAKRMTVDIVFDRAAQVSPPTRRPGE